MLNAETFEKLDRTIHERGRLAIMSLLAVTGCLSFTELKEQLRMTDGNLSVHLRTLEEGGFVAVHRSRVKGKARTQYSLTPEGRDAFREYIRALGEIVRQSEQAEQHHAASVASPLGDVKPALQPGVAPAK